MLRSHLTLLVALAACAAAPAARADDLDDGVYGRLDGDLVLSAEITGGLALAPSESAGVATACVRARFLEMTGLAVGYTLPFAASRHDAAWAAVDFRPAWLARFTNDYEHGPRWLDLLLDSIGIELGAAWRRPGRGDGEGAGFVLGGGFEVPLAWSRGDGLMLRLGARWITSGPYDAQGTSARDGVVELGAGLVVRTLVRSGLVGRFQ